MPEALTDLRFLWLDLTRKCQLQCAHCYNASGPDGDHGTMTREHWFEVLAQACKLGVSGVQLIGGEVTLHPHAIELAKRAWEVGLRVEVFSNLVHVSDAWWELLQRDGMSLATSYYSDRAEEHNAMTGRRSHGRTRANISKAVRLGVPLRVGVIGDDEDRIRAAQRGLTGPSVLRSPRPRWGATPVAAPTTSALRGIRAVGARRGTEGLHAGRTSRP
ncbi:radical SAM protein [Streptomyces sp. O3]